MGGQMGQMQPQRPVSEEIQTGPRAMQLGGLFGNPAITQMIQALIQSGALGAGPGGFAQGPAGAPTVQAPALQTGQGGLFLDVGTMPPGIQGPAVTSPVAPGVAPPGTQDLARAPGQPVLPPPPPPMAAPSPAMGGMNMPQWLAQVIADFQAGGAMGGGPPAGNINVFEGAAPDFTADPTGIDQEGGPRTEIA